MRVLVVDDNNDKILNIVSTLSEVDPRITFDTAGDIISAKKKLATKKYQLLIVDILLPTRNGGEAKSDGGVFLLKEINRLESLNAPSYIVGVTQFEELSSGFSGIWRVVMYNPSVSTWKEPLIEIAKYALRTLDPNVNNSAKHILPTIFVEGESDQKIFSKALQLFFPEYTNKIQIQAEGGANLVAKKLVVWAFSLAKDENQIPIKAIGLLDGDMAADEAKREFQKYVNTDHSGHLYCRISQLTPTHAKGTIPLFQKGISFGICVEDLFPSEVLKTCHEYGWSEQRQLNDPKNWDKHNTSLKVHLESLSLTEDESIYLKRIKLTHKVNFCEHVLNASDEKAVKLFENLKVVLKESIEYLLKKDVK